MNETKSRPHPDTRWEILVKLLHFESAYFLSSLVIGLIWFVFLVAGSISDWNHNTSSNVIFFPIVLVFIINIFGTIPALLIVLALECSIKNPPVWAYAIGGSLCALISTFLLPESEHFWFLASLATKFWAMITGALGGIAFGSLRSYGMIRFA